MRDTAHLSMLEDACLGRMLRWYYANEKPLPADIHQVYRLVRCAAQKEREAVDTVLQEFFVLREDGYHQKRADAEIARYQAKQSKARASVNSRWERQRLVKQTNNGGTTGELPTLYERITDDIHRAPVPKNQEPRTKEKTNTRAQRCRAPLPPDFEKFWKAYPKKRSKGEAEKAWLSLRPDEQLTANLLAAVERAKTLDDWKKDGGKYVPHPATWLRAKGWEDELLPASSAAPGSDLSWLFSENATKAKARELGLTDRPGESWDEFRRRIQAEEKRREVA